MMYRFVLGLLLLGAQLCEAFVVAPGASIVSSSARSQPKHQRTTDLSMWSNDDNIEGADRIKACIPYLFPILDGDHFGAFIYSRIPALGMADYVLIRPLENIYEAIPFGSVIFFLVLTIGTRGNTDMSRAVRFSAQQAALIDVALVFPELLGSATVGVDVPRSFMEPCANFVYYTYMAMVIYCIYSNLTGQKPNQIPWISPYAELAVGPF
jgi:hypothetical protein